MTQLCDSKDPVGKTDSPVVAVPQGEGFSGTGENLGCKDVVETQPTDEEDEEEFVKGFLQWESDGPPKSDLAARLEYLNWRIEELREDARDCGCDSAMGYYDDNSVRHMQLDCAYNRRSEYRAERKEIRSKLRFSKEKDKQVARTL
ncbi:hypothetical protein CVT26_004047 [Gymnopilus dilepis]|uniref:Uncharacterized protein n=1 Tax=Gymnopilus dilepis TaxID=231916 RepID=A0A409YMQ0_9AGAR|nr:hypothetical protein CVT26_004047 [Gymnopilus dilepis]